MFAREESPDERFEIQVGNRHAGRAEGRHDLQTSRFEVSAPEENHDRKPVQPGLAQRIDFVVVGGKEARHAEPSPILIAPAKPVSIRTERLEVEFVTAHDEAHAIGNRFPSNPWH